LVDVDEEDVVIGLSVFQNPHHRVLGAVRLVDGK
jgi:hypothetical protein